MPMSICTKPPSGDTSRLRSTSLPSMAHVYAAWPERQENCSEGKGPPEAPIGRGRVTDFFKFSSRKIYTCDTLLWWLSSAE